MKREYLSIDALPAWARLNGVSTSGVAFRRLQEEDGANKGVALVATEDKGGEDSDLDVLLQIPSDLILSLDCVETCAKSDPYLREILEAVGGFGKVTICFFFFFKKMWHGNVHRSFMLNMYRRLEVRF